MNNSLNSILDRLFGKSDQACGSESTIFVGLGNPGAKYVRTPHNLGFSFIDHLAAKHHVKLDKRTKHTLVGHGMIGARQVILVKPKTYVNNSGIAIKSLMSRYNTPLQSILIVYDELNLPPGKIKLSRDGGAGGHNGIKSIISSLGSSSFPRLRIGIGRPLKGNDQISYVLGKMSPEDHETAITAIEIATEAAHVFLTNGISEAMNQYN